MDKKVFTFLEIKQKMANYCAYQDRCHAEVETKMREFVLIPEAKEELMLYLIQENFLNEERFTRSYIRGKFYMKGWGKNKIKMHLKQKQIGEKLIHSCWDEIDDQDYEKELRKQYDAYYLKLKGLQDYQKHSKTIRFLMGRGFEYDLIQNVKNS